MPRVLAHDGGGGLCDGEFPARTARSDRDALHKSLAGLTAVGRIGMGATGPYHQRLADTAHASVHSVQNARDLSTTGPMGIKGQMTERTIVTKRAPT